MEQTLSTDMLEALAASSPHPEHREELMLFGQFIGSWDFDWTGYQPDGTTITARGEWHFGWVLEGRAVEDVWICPSRAERERGDTRQGEYGATLRVYDPSIEAWRCTWHGPSFGNHRIFLAGLRGDESSWRGRPRRAISSTGRSPTSSRIRSGGATRFRKTAAPPGASRRK